MGGGGAGITYEFDQLNLQVMSRNVRQTACWLLVLVLVESIYAHVRHSNLLPSVALLYLRPTLSTYQENSDSSEVWDKLGSCRWVS